MPESLERPAFAINTGKSTWSLLLSSEEMAQTLEKLASSIISRHGDCKNLALIGIQRRGVTIAERLRALMEKSGHEILSGTLDITLYRDDWTTKSLKPSVGETKITFDVADKILILVDDVLFTGRTIRSALEALVDFGRPGKVELLVLVDRGHRELPIQADFAGLVCNTKKSDRVDVLVKEIDGEEGIRLVRGTSIAQ